MTSCTKINLKFGKRLAKTGEGLTRKHLFIEPVKDFFYISNGLKQVDFLNFSHKESEP